MKRLSKLLLIIPTLAILIFLLLSTFLSSALTPCTYDPYENRDLAVRPVFSVQTVLGGEFFSGVETYLSDHIYGRTAMLRAQTALHLLYQSSVNNVVLTKQTLLPDNGLVKPTDMQAITSSCEDIVSRLSAIRQVTEDCGGQFLYVSVPSQRTVFRSYYPDYLNSSAEYIDVITNAFTATTEKYALPCLYLRDSFTELNGLTDYYSTVDHHFTLRGAYRCYLEICATLQKDGLQFPVATQEHISFSPLPNTYLGSYGRKLYGLSEVTDSILTYSSDLEVPFRRWDYGVEKEPTVITLPKTQSEFVFYTAYMGGDRGETIIQTERPELPDVLIVGDSFTNALESLFYMSFDEMRSLDFRHYNAMTLSDYIRDYQPDLVLFIRDDTSCILLEGNGSVT